MKSLPTEAPPNDIEAERALIGCILLSQSNHALDIVADAVAPEDFYHAKLGAWYGVALELHSKGQEVSAATFKAAIADRKLFNRREHYDTDLWFATTSEVLDDSNAGFYAKRIADHSRRRKLIKGFAEAQRDAATLTRPVNDTLEQVEELSTKHAPIDGSRFVGLGESLGAVLDNYRDVREGKVEPGLNTGISALDGLTYGMRGGELTVLAARPSMGKTALALAITANASLHEGSRVAFFSLETPHAQITRSLMAIAGGVSTNILRRGPQGRVEEELVADACEIIAPAEELLRIDDTPSLSIAQLRSRARSLMATWPFRLLVIDYLQLMDSVQRDRAGQRHEEVAQISRGLKKLSLELETPILALAQLNRKVEDRKDKRPLLSDLRESGSIEADADVALLLTRDAYYDRSNEEIKEDALLIVAKNRGGPTGELLLRFQPEFIRFSNPTASQIARHERGGRR